MSVQVPWKLPVGEPFKVSLKGLHIEGEVTFIDDAVLNVNLLDESGTSFAGPFAMIPEGANGNYDVNVPDNVFNSSGIRGEVECAGTSTSGNIMRRVNFKSLYRGEKDV